MTDPPAETPNESDRGWTSQPVIGGTTSGYRLAPAPEAVIRRVVRRQRSKAFAEETIRALLAILALVLVIMTVVLGWVSASSSHWESAKDWLAAVLPAETGILGSALGFYFGSSKKDDD